MIEVTDYNKMYAATDIEGRIDCPTCSTVYVFTKPYSSLERIADIERHRAEWNRVAQLEDAIRRIYCEPVAAELEDVTRAAGRRKEDWFRYLGRLLPIHSIDDFARELRRSGNLSNFLRSAVTIDRVEALALAVGWPPNVEMATRIAEARAARASVAPVPRLSLPNRRAR